MMESQMSVHELADEIVMATEKRDAEWMTGMDEIMAEYKANTEGTEYEFEWNIAEDLFDMLKNRMIAPSPSAGGRTA